MVAGAISPSYATEGYFQHGYGARQKALAGAGVAFSTDATAIALNPAGLIHVDDQLNLSVSIFSPRRELVGGSQLGANLTPTGKVESGTEYFAIPNFAISKRIEGSPLFDVIGFSAYGNGGMNTDYDHVTGGAACGAVAGAFGLTGNGVFCNRKSGVNLEQLLLSFSIAKEIMPGVSVGIAPILARQAIEIDGLALFNGFSNSPGFVTNKGVDAVWGYGLRAGLEITPMKGFRIGIAGNTRIKMAEFSKYRGLFAENGDFDIPPSLQVGIAVDVTPNLTIMADYKRIWYSQVASINNPVANIVNCATAGGPQNPSCLGGALGPGFGWEDIDIFKVALEWRASEDLTLRLGYAHNEAPFSGKDNLFNIIAPATVTDHFTAGAKLRVSDKWDVEIAGMYAPEETISGTEIGIPTRLGVLGNPNHTIDLSMHQFEITLGAVYRFGAEDEPLK